MPQSNRNVERELRAAMAKQARDITAPPAQLDASVQALADRLLVTMVTGRLMLTANERIEAVRTAYRLAENFLDVKAGSWQ